MKDTRKATTCRFCGKRIAVIERGLYRKAVVDAEIADGAREVRADGQRPQAELREVHVVVLPLYATVEIEGGLVHHERVIELHMNPLALSDGALGVQFEIVLKLRGLRGERDGHAAVFVSRATDEAYWFTLGGELIEPHPECNGQFAKVSLFGEV